MELLFKQAALAVIEPVLSDIFSRFHFRSPLILNGGSVARFLPNLAPSENGEFDGDRMVVRYHAGSRE
jgi:hypothetical protein